MEKLNTFIFLLIVVLIAFLVAFLARKRGRSPVVWFFAGLFLGWISLIFLYLLPDETQDQDEDERNVSNRRNQYKDDDRDELGVSGKGLLGNDTAKGLESKVCQTDISEKELQGWYYLNKEGKQQGPVELRELKEFFKGEQIRATTYVWHEGMADWKKIAELPWLKQELGLE
jgi:hypothetical protein